MKLPSGFDTPVQIGQGSYGTVYRVRQKQLDRQVVIKMIPLSKNKIRNQRFQEAVTQAKLLLPCSPQVYDVFIWKENICIVMQWIRSLDLHKCISMDLDKNLRLEIADGIIKAVSSLHERGYAHRDLKPGNILLSPSDGIFLIDFGFTAKDCNLGTDNVLIGTSGYIAPEMFERQSEKINSLRADCYALGIILNDILGIDNDYPALKTLTDPDPAKRPANAVEAYNLWRKLTADVVQSQFESVIDQLVRKSVSTSLLESSQKLVKLQRYNEAYRLCLECLNETPDNPDAIKMISTFGNNSERKLLRSRAIIAGTILAAGIIIATILLVMKKQRILYNSTSSVSSNSDQKHFRSSFLNTKRINNNIEYRDHPSESLTLVADVYFSIDNVDCLVFIDGKLIGKKDRKKPVIHCNLPAGKYRVSFIGTGGNFIASEQIDVLPFRQMHVNAAEYLN